MDKVPKNAKVSEGLPWLYSVRCLTSILLLAVGVIEWFPAYYVPWVLYSVSFILLVMYLMLRTRTWESAPDILIEPVLAPLQLAIVVSLLSPHWPQANGRHSVLSNSSTLQ